MEILILIMSSHLIIYFFYIFFYLYATCVSTRPYKVIHYIYLLVLLVSLQDLTVLPTKFFRRHKTHIPSVINLPTESPTEMLRR